jgi:predicted RNA polymerase sigma factor
MPDAMETFGALIVGLVAGAVAVAIAIALLFLVLKPTIDARLKRLESKIPTATSPTVACNEADLSDVSDRMATLEKEMEFIEPCTRIMGAGLLHNVASP